MRENLGEQTFVSYGMLVGGMAQRALAAFFEGHQPPTQVPSLVYLVAVLFKDYLLNERCWFGWTAFSAGAHQGARDTSEWVRGKERKLNARFPDVLTTVPARDGVTAGRPESTLRLKR